MRTTYGSVASGVAFAAALAATGCHGTPTGPDASVDVVTLDQSAPVDSVGPVDVGSDALPACVPDDAGGVCIQHVRGQVVDLAGAPVDGLITTVCGDICFFGSTAADGTFDITPSLPIDPTAYAVIVHGRPDHAGVYAPLPALVDGIVTLPAALVAPLYTVVGPHLPDGTAGGTVTAGDVTLTIAPGTTLMYSVEDTALGALGMQLRVASVPIAQSPPFVAAAGGIVAVWALSPFELAAQPGVGVQVANHVGLAAGTAVDFVVMGDNVVTPPIDGGHPVVAATGHVSVDGQSIATDPGQSVQTLTWLAVRPHS